MKEGRINKEGRPDSLPPAWHAMAAKAGGVGALAEVLSVSPVTLWRWAKGQRHPRNDDRQNIIELAAILELDSPI